MQETMRQGPCIGSDIKYSEMSQKVALADDPEMERPRLAVHAHSAAAAYGAVRITARPLVMLTLAQHFLHDFRPYVLTGTEY